MKAPGNRSLHKNRYDMSKNKKFLDYNSLIRDNLLNVVKHALSKTSDYGLTDGHHFYITFITNFKENVLPSYLVKDYPDNMMIVIENEFWNLKVFDSYFLVDLKFKEDRNIKNYV